MKLLPISLLAAMTSVIWAEKAPESYSSGRYQGLVKHSPFTDPLVEVSPDPPVGELPDWSLVGVRKYRDEQFVTVMNTKDRSQRIEIPGEKAQELGFRLVEVEVARSFLNTKVKVRKGDETGWLEYDPKVIRAKTVPTKTVPQKALQKSQQPPVPGKRVRYVPRPK